ncbi:MAG: hypothetical protein HGB03_00185 [Candidatus Yonathbacteria bacterium]|nr:hypothetical protein [Candidatus Yonathbacteria bacterium]NTW48098.1 hypothetical protein [Candidatus Yonathbacteria bacterium]
MDNLLLLAVQAIVGGILYCVRFPQKKYDMARVITYAIVYVAMVGEALGLLFGLFLEGAIFSSMTMLLFIVFAFSMRGWDIVANDIMAKTGANFFSVHMCMGSIALISLTGTILGPVIMIMFAAIFTGAIVFFMVMLSAFIAPHIAGK